MTAPKAPVYAAPLLSNLDAAAARGRGRFLHLGHFDAPTESPSHDELLDAQVRLNDVLLELADLGGVRSILDVGCGIGGTLAEIGRRFPHTDLVGLNVDPRQLEIARASTPPPADGSLRWVEGDACALPFEACTFERALAIECIFHFGSRAGFLAEAARVLVDDGLLVVSDLVARRGEPAEDAALESAVRSGLGPWPDLFGDDADHAALGARVGLRLERTDDATMATRPSWAAFERTGGRARAPMDEAVARLGALHRGGRLSVRYLVFRKGAQPQ